MMDVALDVGQLAIGLALLYFGAEWLVGGAAGLARSFGIRPLVIGLTVVAYGTSSPELVVGISAGLRDQGAIALGNVIGSNIANLGLILAICALIRAPQVDRQIIAREVPVLLVATALVTLVLLDGRVSTAEACALLVLAVGYTAWMIVTSARGSAVQAEEVAADAATASGLAPSHSRRRLAFLTLGGLGGLISGGYFYGKAPVMRSRVSGVVGGRANELNISGSQSHPRGSLR